MGADDDQLTSGKRARTASDDGQRTSKKAHRKRAALACEECRSRKRRCDGAIPACGGCTRRLTTCIYSSEVEAKAWQHSTIQALRSRLEELEGAEASSQSEGPSLGDADSITCAPDGNFRPAPQFSHDSTSGARRSGHEPSTHAHGTYDSATSNNPRQTYLTPPPLESCSADNPELRSFEKLMKPVSRAISRKCDSPLTSAPTAFNSRNPTADCTCDRALSATKWSLPLRRDADGLVATYFSRPHRIYPILHQRTFQKQYDRLWDPGSESRAGCSGLCRKGNACKLFAATLQAVFALATLFAPDPPEENATQADTFFCQAQGLAFFDILDDETGLELVQLGLIMGFYLQGTERFSKCWNVTGLTIRLAQNMGLDLSLTEARKRGLVKSRPTQLEYEMRNRVWYGCVILEREVSMSFGRKLAGSIGSGNGLPNSIDDGRLSDEAGKWNTQPDGLPSLVESFIETAKLYDILDEILDREELHEAITPLRDAPSASGSTSNVGTILELDTMVTEWRNKLPRYLRYDPNSTIAAQVESVTLDGLSIPSSDFLVQAKRLYLRFLHVRMLILRPTLDRLFDKQQEGQQDTARQLKDAPLEEAVLCNVASQCVQSAQKLVAFLDAEVRSHGLQAWWYNVSYLHSCASTILMGRLCSFADGSVSEEMLTMSWHMCLQGLSRYTKISSISRKSLRLLQDSARSLLLNEGGERAQHDNHDRIQRCPQRQGRSVIPDVNQNNPGGSPNPKDFPEEVLGANFPLSSGLDTYPLEGLEVDFGLSEETGVLAWPLPQFPSQLEALDIDFNLPDQLD